MRFDSTAKTKHRGGGFYITTHLYSSIQSRNAEVGGVKSTLCAPPERTQKYYNWHEGDESRRPSLFILELTEFDVRSPREEPRAEITAEGPEQVCLRQSQQSDSTEAQPSHKAAHVVFTVEEFRETEITQAVRRGEKLQMKYLCEGRKKKKS